MGADLWTLPIIVLLFKVISGNILIIGRICKLNVAFTKLVSVREIIGIRNIYALQVWQISERIRTVSVLEFR